MLLCFGEVVPITVLRTVWLNTWGSGMVFPSAPARTIGLQGFLRGSRDCVTGLISKVTISTTTITPSKALISLTY